MPSRIVVLTLAGLLAGAGAFPALAQVLFRDDFNGSALDTRRWMVGTWNLGRTRFGHTPAVSGGLARLRVDTYNPAAPGQLFKGTEILTRQNFPLGQNGQGLEYTARLRMVPMPGGFVGAFYAYNTDARGLSDEIDFELLSNWANAPRAPANDRMLVSTWDDWDRQRPTYFDGVHHSDARPAPAGFDAYAFNTYTMRWLPGRTDWLVNGKLVHSTTQAQADLAMPLKLNLWAPAANWAEAYNPAYGPTANPYANRIWQMEVDYAQVSAIPSWTAQSLLRTAPRPVAAVPEPAAAATALVTAALALLRRRRR